MRPRDGPPSNDADNGHESGPATVRRSMERDGPPSYNVIRAVATATGTVPERMRPLHHAIDPDALDQLFETTSEDPRRSPNVSVSFRYEGCTVTIREDRHIRVSVQAGEDT